MVAVNILNLLKQTVNLFREIPSLKLFKNCMICSKVTAMHCGVLQRVLQVGELHRGGSVTNEATLLVFVINDYLFKPGNTGKVVVLLLQKVISFVSLIKEPLGLTCRCSRGCSTNTFVIQ